MDRVYLDEALSRLASEPGYQPDGWNHTEVKEYRRLVQCARAAKVDSDLRNMRMLRIEPHDDHDPNRARAALSSGRVIGLTFKSSDSPAVAFDLLTPETEPRDE